MKTFVISFCLMLPFLGYTQDTIPQIQSRDHAGIIHKIHIAKDTVSLVDKRDKIFFLNTDGAWEEIPLYTICPVCTVCIISCTYRNNDNVLIIEAIITFNKVILRFKYKNNTWEEIQASE